MDLDKKEKQLQERRQKLAKLEQEILEKEKALKLKEKQKKQLILRLPASLWQDIAIWADEDLRSINSQIEYILKQAVNQHKKNKSAT